MAQKYLDKVYSVNTADDVRELYDAWSDSYDAEVAENGYATPARTAKALYEKTNDPAAPILDFGCGTGLSGLALKLSGFETIDGMDLSREMLVQAETKGVYRSLTAVDADAPLPFDAGDYAAITAIGVIGAGAAPVSVLDDLIARLDRGGLLAFSLNDHALKERGNKARLNEYFDTGTVRLLFHEYGPHLPGIDLKSSVYVLEKA